MTSWRDALAAPFVAGLSRVTAVADPDALLLDAQVQRTLTARGFTVVTYGDALAFRVNYESVWRAGWERGDLRELIVRVEGDELDVLPFDVLRDARRLSVDRARLFPGVPRRVLAGMPVEGLDWLAKGPTRAEIDRADARIRRLGPMLDALDRDVPVGDTPHERWTQFAMRWAELQALRYEDSSAPRPWEARIEVLHDRIEALFEGWMTRNFEGLRNRSPVPPVMLHHVPRAMLRTLEGGASRRVALVVLDGMAIDQWLVLRATLDLATLGATEVSSAVFAWVPTTTAVSRQSVFAGKPPLRFATQLSSTSGEPTLWRTFWREEANLRDEAVGYLKGLGDAPSDELDAMLGDHRLRVLGLVVDKVDTILHGIALGTAGMHNQVRQWGHGAWLSRTLRRLLDAGFTVYVTSDHGNVELVGTGRVADGAFADVRGERVRIFSDDVLRQKIARNHVSARCWRSTGLPETFLCLIASGRTAFTDHGRRIVGHGGLALEEVIVPLSVFSRSE
ncbi:MAG: BREX-3 system phosphatase PglZ [Polyangiales bacterium]